MIQETTRLLTSFSRKFYSSDTFVVERSFEMLCFNEMYRTWATTEKEIVTSEFLCYDQKYMYNVFNKKKLLVRVSISIVYNLIDEFYAQLVIVQISFD